MIGFSTRAAPILVQFSSISSTYLKSTVRKIRIIIIVLESVKSATFSHIIRQFVSRVAAAYTEKVFPQVKVTSWLGNVEWVSCISGGV